MSRLDSEINRIESEILNPVMNQMYESIVERIDNNTILISGSTGMLGSQICFTLLALNQVYNCSIKVIALARDREKVLKIFKDFDNVPDISFIYSDILDPIKLDYNVDYIIHTAGVTGGSKQHVDQPLRTIFTALDGTRNILNLALEKQVKHFIYISSLEIYGDTNYNFASVNEKDIGSLDCLNVRSSYSESKRMCECICSSYNKQYGLPTSIARLTATFGPGVYYRDGRVFAQFARSVIEGRDIILHSTGDTIRNYCDVSDAANACLLLLFKGEQGDAYNVANMNTAVSIFELANIFIENSDSKKISLKIDIPDNFKNMGYRDTVKIRLDSSKLMKLGWQPYYGLKDMVIRLIKGMVL